MTAELAIYEAMEPPLAEYQQGVKDGIEAACRRFNALRHNASSQHTHPANDTKPSETCYLRIDHIDETLLALLAFASVTTEDQEVIQS